MVFSDRENPDNIRKATVKRYESASDSWEIVGTAGFSAEEAYSTDIALDSNDTPYVVYRDLVNTSYELTVKKYE